MSVFTLRRTVAAVSMALVAATLATPASAHELDEDVLAASICPAGVNTEGAEYSESAESGNAAEVDLYTYAVGEDILGNPLQLCTFAIISTDEDSKLAGQYTLSVGALESKTGAVAGEAFVTAPIVTLAAASPSATVTSSGVQSTPKTNKEKRAAKSKYNKTAKAAKAKYDKTAKAAKAKYKKAGKAAKARKAMSKKIAAAKKKYRAALATATATKNRQSAPSERSYTLNLTLPFVD